MKRNATNRSNKLWAAGGPGLSSKTDDWATPQPVFDALNREFHFTLDACASPANAKCRHFYTVADDGLAQEWAGRVWLNPPYGREIEAWLEKAADAADDGATVVCLIPSRTDTIWWHEQVLARAAELRLVKGRLKFGSGKAPAPFPSAIVVFRPGNHPLKVSAWLRPEEAGAR